MIDCNGVGYQCQAPLGTAERLQQRGDHVRLFVLVVQQEELPRLLGFATPEERDLCRLLLKIGGIGPSLALALLSADSPERLLHAIEAQDLNWLKRIKGVGPKTAQRICFEVKERAAQWLGVIGREHTTAPTPHDAIGNDAVQALVSLGFLAGEAETRVNKVRQADPDAGAEAIVKAALRG